MLGGSVVGSDHGWTTSISDQSQLQTLNFGVKSGYLDTTLPGFDGIGQDHLSLLSESLKEDRIRG